jgi:hypothetical protein
MNLSTKNFLLAIILFVLLTTSLAFAIHTVLYQNTLGVDLYCYYLAGQSLFKNHQSPYNQEAVNQVQLVIYHRLAYPWEDHFAFSYPLHSLFVLLPLYWLDYDWTQAIWLAINLLLLVTSILLVLPSGPRWLAVSVIFLYPFSFGLIMGNFAVILGVVVFLMFHFCFINYKEVSTTIQILLGIFLAWATSKPQFIWLFLLLFCFGMLKNKLWPLVISFAASLVAFLVTNFLLVPDWIQQMVTRQRSYYIYNNSWSTLSNFLRLMVTPSSADATAYMIFVGLLGVTFRLGFLWWKGKITPLFLFGWCGFITYLIHPHAAPFEQIIFLIPILTWIGQEKYIRPTWKVIFWLGGMLFYWIVFMLGRNPSHPITVYDWPMIYYLPWLVWLYYHEKETAIQVKH